MAHSFLQLATDINRNISNMIHLSNNLRYNAFQLLNSNYSNLLTNDIMFPSSLRPLPPIAPPPSVRPVRRRTTRPRRTFSRPTLPINTGEGLPNEVFRFGNGATPDEIGRETELFVYRDLSTNQTMCPISQQNFLPEDNILRIRHCGHIFTANRLRQWFRSHSDCPVCRFDIRPALSPAIESMLREIATQTFPPTDTSNNSVNYEYSLFTRNLPI